MTFQQELSSWWAPKAPTIGKVPSIGSTAPSTPRLGTGTGRPIIVAFLRHCGCPFAEKTFLNLRETARRHNDIDFVAVSHSDEASTNTWLRSLPQAGSEPENLRVVVDDKVELYAAWGLGPSSYAHVLSPSALWDVWRLARDEGISNRPTESGSRWQTSGFFAVDGEGIVRWGRAAHKSNDIPDFEEAVKALEGESGEIKAKL
jgi:hypothetical protein